MGLRTTTIGAYPKPDYVPLPNWFDLGADAPEAPTATFDPYFADRSDAAMAAFDRATQEIVAEQVGLGIDVPTDGEIRREFYVYYHCRHIDGISFSRLTRKAMRNGSWTARVPTITGALAPGAPFLARDWRVAQQSAPVPVKITVPGPLTIIDSTANAHYQSDAALAPQAFSECVLPVVSIVSDAL